MNHHCVRYKSVVMMCLYGCVTLIISYLHKLSPNYMIHLENVSSHYVKLEAMKTFSVDRYYIGPSHHTEHGEDNKQDPTDSFHLYIDNSTNSYFARAGCGRYIQSVAYQGI